MSAASSPAGSSALPRQVPFIIGNEAGERFGFYGMRNILTKFLIGWLFVSLPLAERDAAAKETFHAFVMGVYFFPLAGGFIADRLWGRYQTILRLSMVYIAGFALLAFATDSRPAFMLGLFFIAVGAGGIKPCVSPFVGDQFDQSNKALAKVVFDAFYWVINFGSFFASLLMPLVLTGGPEPWRPKVAFGIPGVVMTLATLLFWLGRHRYVRVPPAPKDPHSFFRVLTTALTARQPARHPGQPEQGRPGLALAGVGGALALGSLVATPWLGAVAALCLALVWVLGFGGAGAWLQLERARPHHPEEDVDGARAVLRVLVVFALVTPFWSLFDQKASTWILQGEAMALPGWGWFKSGSQMQALNPLLVMLLIPFNNAVLFPLLRRAGVAVTPLRRMGAGIALAGASWVAVGALQLWVDAQAAQGLRVPVLWQLVPYVLLTSGEVLVSATGLEFAYSQAPERMKSVVTAFFHLSVTVGNLWVLLVNASVKQPAVTELIVAQGWGVAASQMFFFAAFALAAALAFAWYGRRFPMADYYRKAG